MTAKSTKDKKPTDDTAEPTSTLYVEPRATLYVVARARYPVRKPGVWTLIGIYTTERAAKSACIDRWCAYGKVDQNVPIDVTTALEKGQVCLVTE